LQSDKPRKKKEKKEDDGKPKRPMTAFMIWINSNREDIKKKFPGIGVTDVAKKGGEMWKEMTDKSVSIQLFAVLCFAFIVVNMAVNARLFCT
jgi:HMG (high mobility group) box